MQWGDHLLCAVPGKKGPVEVEQLKTLHSTNKRGVCGKTFKKGASAFLPSRPCVLG